jgi:hypothetical protein
MFVVIDQHSCARFHRQCRDGVTDGTAVGLASDGCVVPAGGDIPPFGIATQTSVLDPKQATVAVGRGIFRTDIWLESCKDPVGPGDLLCVREGVLIKGSDGNPVTMVLNVYVDQIIEFMTI